jgi:hypothetical protein
LGFMSRRPSMRLGDTSDRQRKAGYTQDAASFLSLCVYSSRDSYTVNDAKGKPNSYPEPEKEQKRDSREGPGGSLPEMMNESAAEFKRTASDISGLFLQSFFESPPSLLISQPFFRPRVRLGQMRYL